MISRFQKDKLRKVLKLWHKSKIREWNLSKTKNDLEVN
jgi:hypothetical protein